MGQVQLNPTKSTSVSPGPQCLLKSTRRSGTGHSDAGSTKASAHLRTTLGKNQKGRDRQRDVSQVTDYSAQAQNLRFHYTGSLSKKKKKSWWLDIWRQEVLLK